MFLLFPFSKLCIFHLVVWFGNTEYFSNFRASCLRVLSSGRSSLLLPPRRTWVLRANSSPILIAWFSGREDFYSISWWMYFTGALLMKSKYWFLKENSDSEFTLSFIIRDVLTTGDRYISVAETLEKTWATFYLSNWGRIVFLYKIRVFLILSMLSISKVLIK